MTDENIGVAPPNTDTPVGRFRVLYGDTSYEPTSPPIPDMGNYGELSDAEIETFIEAGQGSVARAIGLYNFALASKAAAEAKLVKDFDLQLSTQQRADQLRRAGQEWMKQADAEDSAAGSADIFELFPVGGDSWVAEGTVPVYGRKYDWSRFR